ncbi:restriction endonuclease subunit S [Listeria monocytogenes]|nr:restriction endonuclease subunit S [Listeria monocytogenes]MCD1852254.1 restriction endonuclease subunit S [Listeria monocytogenes]MCD1858115.1 restriction endonuclease subunit S [Listeria monocytogenes]HED6497138.1 restriction endonuclease subunit S [Listeria monocytogenes]HED6497842.1 restriction endonuclease subunit S [Listeria monocytogenes]
MTSDYKTTSLGAVVDFIAKGIPPKYTDEKNENSVVVLNQKTNRNFQIDYSVARLNDLTKKKVAAEKLLKDNDILINSTGVGTAGRIAQLFSVPEPTTVDGHMIILRADSREIDPIYLGYALKSQQPKIESLQEGSTGQTELNRQRLLDEIQISFPKDRGKQEEIGSIFLSIDNRIEQNKEINHHLVELAVSIWQKRFSSQDTNGKLGDIIELYDSKRVPLSSKQRQKMDKIYPYYGATSLMDYVDNYLFDGIYLLLGEDGTVISEEGYPILQYVWGKFWVNNHAHILVGRNGFTVESLYVLLKSTNVSSIVTGAVQLKINQANLKSVEVYIPSAGELESFNSTIKPIFDQLRNSTNEIETLTKLRDSLLPKLMSGEISVAD